MVIVFVKHYLNQDGINHLNTKWFPYVKSIMSKKPGYVDFTNEPDAKHSDCANLTVRFKDAKTFDEWVADKDHGKVINDLDQYRTNDWQWARQELNIGEKEDLTKLVWNPVRVDGAPYTQSNRPK